MAFERTKYYGDRVIEAGRRPMDSILSPLKPIAWLFKIAIAIFLIFLITIPLAVGIFYFSYRSVQTGTADAFVKIVEVKVGNIPLIGPYSVYVATQLGRFLKTGGASLLASDYGTYESVVDKNSANDDLGIKIKNFQPIKRTYVSGESVSLFADLEAETLKDKSNIRINCIADGEITGNTAPASIILDANAPSITTVSCSFPKDKLKTEKDITTKKIDLSAIYDFKTEAYYDFWAMGKDEFKKYRIQYRKNPLNDVNDPNVADKEKGVIKTVYSDGPMKIGVITGSQPFTEEVYEGQNFYTFTLLLKKNFGWEGNLVKIENVYLTLADTFELNTNQQGSSSYNEALDTFILEKTDGRFKTYKLSPDEVENKLNNICSDLGITDLASPLFFFRTDERTDECLKRLDGGLPTIATQIKVNNLEGSELKKYPGLRIEVEYKYQSNAETYVTITKKGDIVT